MPVRLALAGACPRNRRDERRPIVSLPEKIRRCVDNLNRAANCGVDFQTRRRRERYGFLQEVPLSLNGECSRSRRVVYADLAKRCRSESMCRQGALAARVLEKDNATS